MFNVNLISINTDEKERTPQPGRGMGQSSHESKEDAMHARSSSWAGAVR